MARMDAQELTRRSIAGFAETLAAFGATGVRGATPVRRPEAIGARVAWATDNHWIDAAVVPPGAQATAGADGLPHCLWALPGAVQGGAPLADIDMPCMGLVLDDVPAGPQADVAVPPLDVVGALNDRAYGQHERLAPLISALADPRVRAYGVRAGDAWACVLLALRVDDDVSIQFVATEAEHRRRGLASALMRAALADARADGASTATLQASPDGRPVYERLGFVTVATLHPTIV
jgi:ribosomal protein S18 acetylase RimI-like enzyme